MLSQQTLCKIQVSSKSMNVSFVDLMWNDPYTVHIHFLLFTYAHYLKSMDATWDTCFKLVVEELTQQKMNSIWYSYIHIPTCREADNHSCSYSWFVGEGVAKYNIIFIYHMIASLVGYRIHCWTLCSLGTMTKPSTLTS